MAPVVHGLEDKYGGMMNFAYLDIDDPNTESMQQALSYDRRWRPFIFLVSSSGEVLDIFIGYTDGKQLEQAIVNLLVAEGVLGN